MTPATAAVAVTDADIERYTALIRAVIRRMRSQQQLVHSLEDDDLFAIGQIAVWIGLQRWQPERGPKKAYLGGFIAQRLQDHQRQATRATGWSRRLGRHAEIRSLEQPLGEGIFVRDVVAAPDDTAMLAEHRIRLATMRQRATALPRRQRLIAANLLADMPIAQRALSDMLGVSESRISKMVGAVREHLLSDPRV